MLKNAVATEDARHNGQVQPKVKNALRVGLCGIGRAGLGMVKRDLLHRPEIHVAAGYDVLEERARQLAELCSARPCASFDELLEEDLDLVIIATRSNDHVKMAIRAMKSGRDVLVEKPMSIDLAGADRLIAAANKFGRRLFVRHNRRFDPALLHAMEIVESGKIGKLFSVQLRVGGFQHRTDWQTLKKFGGGQLLNWGPHLIDWAVQLIGGTASDVWADLKLIAAGGDAEDHVKLLLRGPTGIVADIEISGATAISQPPWLLLGSNGALEINAEQQCRLRYFDPKKVARPRATADTPVGRAGSHFSGSEEIPWVEETFPVSPSQQPNFWVQLHKAYRRGTPFPITLEQARENMRIVELARKRSKF